MATHHIGEGTVNVSLNLLDEERQVFGRLAVVEDRSLGDLVRRLAVEGLRASHPEQHAKLIEARRSHRQELLTLSV